MSKRSRTEVKRFAQDALMQGIANQLGYYNPNDDSGEEWTEEERDDLRQVMQREADRVAKLFGFEKAWAN